MRLILYDLDGTITAWDTQLLFLNHILKRYRWRHLLMLPFLAALPLHALRLVSEPTMKRLFLGYLWRLPHTIIASHAKEFAKIVVSKHCYAEVVAELNKNLSTPLTTCVLISASPSVYAHAIAKKLGFEADYVLTTEVEFKRRIMPFCPCLTYGNNKGVTKVQRLQDDGFLPKQLPMKQAEAWSDSTADIPMLQAASKQTLINPNTALRAAFPQATILSPPRPYSSRMGKYIALCKQFLGLYPEN